MPTEEEGARRAWFRREILPLEPQLRRYVQRIAPRGLDVDDLVHESFVRVISAPNWRQIGSPAGFLKTTARNLVYDLLRRQNVVPLRSLSAAEEPNIRDEAADPEAVLIGHDQLRRLAELVETLPPQCRKVFTLRKVQGLAPATIAEQLGISVSTVEKHLVKALRLCSEGLARREGGREHHNGVGGEARQPIRAGGHKP